jgi:adenylate cyclase class 1
LFQETITFEIKEGVWRLLPGFWPQNSGTPHAVLKQSLSLIELLCFARLNAIWQGNTRIFIAQSQAISTYELKQIQQAIKEIQAIQINSKSFLQSAKPIFWRIFVNVGVDPQKHLSRKGMQKISSRDDALGFSAIRENLVLTIDLVTINSWGEWQVDRFQGDDSLAKLLFTLLQSQALAKEYGWPESRVHCYCDSRAAAIAKRVEEVVQDVQVHFIQTPKTPYLLEIATSYYLFEMGEKNIELQAADNAQKLLALLQRKYRSYTAYRLDKTALLGSPLRLIYEKSAAGLWQIFFWRKDERLYFYFLDEKGTLLHLQWQEEAGTNSVLYWLMPMLRFLKQLDQRFGQKEQRARERRLTLYELKRKTNSYDFDLLKRQLPELVELPASIDVRAILDHEQQATVYINGQEFSAWQYGEGFYRAITETVRALRQSHGQYPLFLSDLELPDNDNVIDHLQVRHKLESRLAQIS